MMVRRTIHGKAFAMYGFNGQVPGPLIRVPQNATITVRFPQPHRPPQHGALARRPDRQPLRRRAGPDASGGAAGGDFTYQVHFPDAGLYWYHPHVREDIEQSMGLFGNMMVDSPDPDYYAAVNDEQVLVLDDILSVADTLIPFGKDVPDFALSGRVGNVQLVNGEPDYALHVKRGATVRFFLTNVASSRTYNLSFGGAPIKVVGSDVSRFEHEELVPSVVLAPAERAIVEVRFDRPGRYALVNALQTVNHYRGEFDAEVDTLGTVTVDPEAPSPTWPAHSPRCARTRRSSRISRSTANISTLRLTRRCA